MRFYRRLPERPISSAIVANITYVEFNINMILFSFCQKNVKVKKAAGVYSAFFEAKLVL